MSIGRRKAKLIAEQYIAEMILLYDSFESDTLSDADDKLVSEECTKIALKMYDGEMSGSTDEIVNRILKQ